MSRIGRTLKGYLFWTYERGSFHYDIMVTLILAFIFIGPYYINFKDKPVEHIPHRTEVVVAPDGHGGLVYDVESSAVSGHDDGQVRAELLKIIEPISGEVSISKVDTVRDRSGRILQYKVWVQRE